MFEAPAEGQGWSKSSGISQQHVAGFQADRESDQASLQAIRGEWQGRVRRGGGSLYHFSDLFHNRRS